MSSSLPAHITLNEIKQLSVPLPEIELHGLDMGWYIVRLHCSDSTRLWVDEQGEAKRFSGTQWVSRTLAPLGFTHGTVTWGEVTDEMIGNDTPPVSNQQRMKHGVRVAFVTQP
tara:strand:- start:16991 stop:17329 length:339 start_codon:yes stop_codon:yes gene_type:complete